VQCGCKTWLIPTHPQRFVIPDKRSADPEPMPWMAAKQIGCAIQLPPSPRRLRRRKCPARDGEGAALNVQGFIIHRLTKALPLPNRSFPFPGQTTKAWLLISSKVILL
jgi:hypothetical protein